MSVPSRSCTVCVTCRKIWKGGPTCKHETVNLYYKWRAPKATNDKAWKMIERGEYWWDKKAIEKSNGRAEYERNAVLESMRKKRLLRRLTSS